MEHHVPAVEVDIAVCNRQTELWSKILTKIGPQIRIVFQIGRLIAEGYQLSGACPHRHEVPHPNIPCAIQQRIGDIVRRQRREQRLCVGWILPRKKSGDVDGGRHVFS